MNKFKKCPNCGAVSEDIKVWEYTSKYNNKKYYKVVCELCEFQSKPSRFYRIAIWNWNRRKSE